MENQEFSSNKAFELLNLAADHFENGSAQEALLFNREALRNAMGAFSYSWDVDDLRLAVIAYRGVAVSALVTGRNREGTMAIETGVANAKLGLKRWPDATQLREELDRLIALKNKVDHPGEVYVSSNLSSWPFQD